MKHATDAPGAPRHPGRWRAVAWALVPLSALAATLALGVLAAVKSAFPGLAPGLWPMARLQPTHTVAAVAWVTTGTAALLVLVLRRAGATRSRGRATATAGLGGGFVAAAIIGAAAGRSSGLEYVSWPLVLTALPIVLFGVLAGAVYRHFQALVRWSPEGAWLVGLGVALIPLSLIERVIAATARPDFARDLTFEWHALDALFAGWNATLYGVGILMVSRPGAGKPLRATELYVLAGFCLLSTFGHHHYMSPQPELLKTVAFAASMLAGVSFVRHVAIVWRAGLGHAGGAAAPFLIAAELWTLFAIGSGILIAVPHVNLLLHGTHAIVAHSMGSMIGVNTLLILAGMVHFLGDADPPTAGRLSRRVRWVNIALTLVVADLAVAGIVKGVLRMDRPFAAWRPAMLWCLLPLPVLGTLLAAALVGVIAEVLQIIGARRPGPVHPWRKGVNAAGPNALGGVSASLRLPSCVSPSGACTGRSTTSTRSAMSSASGS